MRRTVRGLTHAVWAMAIKGPEGQGTVIAVRDSKDPGGPKLIFSRSKWNEFTASVKNGGLDLA
jgi:hypothetical protein